jgi:hypothetical protein
MSQECNVLSDNHWRIETYHQRITTRQWREVLLAERDTVIYQGRVRNLKAKNIGAGVVDVFKEEPSP